MTDETGTATDLAALRGWIDRTLLALGRAERLPEEQSYWYGVQMGLLDVRREIVKRMSP